MGDEDEVQDQGSNSGEDDTSRNDEDEQSGAGDGGQAEPQTVKVGDKEYTPDQLAALVDKGSKYDSLLPEYTRLTQRSGGNDENAGGSKKSEPQEKQNENAPSYKREGWKPKDYTDLASAIAEAEEHGAKRALEMFKQQQEQSQQEQAQAKQQVDDFVAEVKKSDKDFDQQDFFDYATRHKFPVNTIDDLRAVYSAYSELPKAAKEGEERGRKGRESRQDKVNQPGSGGGKGPDYSDITSRGGNILDNALEAFKRSK